MVVWSGKTTRYLVQGQRGLGCPDQPLTLKSSLFQLSCSHPTCSCFFSPSSRLVQQVCRSACEDQLTMNHHCLAQAQTGGLQDSPSISIVFKFKILDPWIKKGQIYQNNKMGGPQIRNVIDSSRWKAPSCWPIRPCHSLLQDPGRSFRNCANQFIRFIDLRRIIRQIFKNFLDFEMYFYMEQKRFIHSAQIYYSGFCLYGYIHTAKVTKGPVSCFLSTVQN